MIPSPAWAIGFSGWLALQSGYGAVSLALRIPEGETWVLGDEIPLYWRFANRDAVAVGFMWEGCCRLNGKLEVWDVASGTGLSTAPTGQALAHTFARADRLEPGVEKEYVTRVSDWVVLPGTGRYGFRGTYRGVLPFQVPRVPRGLGLWREVATSPPIELPVLGVSDYLAQRDDRSLKRGVRIAVSGPDRISPIRSTLFQVTVENTGAGAFSYAWPDDFSLWVVDAKGHRTAPMAVISGIAEARRIDGDGRTAESFRIAPDRFEGVPLGEYSLFTDLAATGVGRPRVPSGSIPVAWKLGRSEVEELLREAAKGSGPAARNAPLKTLRVYLTEVGPYLAELEREAPNETVRLLANRLGLAARLKPYAPTPGTVRIAVGVGNDGELRWVERRLEEATANISGGIVKRISEVVSVRRHLGWEPDLVLEAAEGTTLGRVAESMARVVSDPSEWAGLPALRGQGDSVVFGRLHGVVAAEGHPPGRDGAESGVSIDGPRVKVRSSVDWGGLVRRVAGLPVPANGWEVWVVRGDEPERR